jgi:hypothetical protein
MPDTYQFFCRQARKFATAVSLFTHNFVFFVSHLIQDNKFGSEDKEILNNKCILFVNLWLFNDAHLTAKIFIGSDVLVVMKSEHIRMYVEGSNITSFCPLSHNSAVQLHITAPMILSGFRAEDLLHYSAVPARICFNEPLRSPYQMRQKRASSWEIALCTAGRCVVRSRHE